MFFLYFYILKDGVVPSSNRRFSLAAFFDLTQQCSALFCQKYFIGTTSLKYVCID